VPTQATASQSAPPPPEGDKLLAYQAMYERQQAAVHALNSFKINETSAFDTTPLDLAYSTLDQAHVLLLVLGISVEELSRNPSETSPLRNIHVGRAIDAIGTLVSLSKFALQAVKS